MLQCLCSTYIWRWLTKGRELYLFRTNLIAARLYQIFGENRRYWTISGKQNLHGSFVKTDKGYRYLKRGRKTEKYMKETWGGVSTRRRLCKIRWVYKIEASKTPRFTYRLQKQGSKDHLAVDMHAIVHVCCQKKLTTPPPPIPSDHYAC